MWKLCVVDDESNRTVVKLVRGDYSVGRAEDSTIRLTERNISRAHARLCRDEDEEWHIEDKGSYTGTFVNGERVSGRRAVGHGDTIQLGDYRLELVDEEQQAVDAKANVIEDLRKIILPEEVAAAAQKSRSLFDLGRGLLRKAG